VSGLGEAVVDCYRNDGLPDVDGRYAETPEKISRQLGRFIEEGWVNIVGGCCGTTPAHIAAIARVAEGASPRRLPIHNRVFVAGIEALELTEENRPVLVGERTNGLGSPPL